MTTMSKRLALTKRKLWNVLLDLRYGGILRGAIENADADQGAFGMHSTPYDVLARIFPPGTIGDSDVLVDIGCGKGGS
jgi:hypothetical protein